MQSAIDLFSTKGFNASSTADIAQRAGVAEVTVFRHYKTKKDILMAVLEQFKNTFGQEIILNPMRKILEKNSGKSQKEILKMMVLDRIELIERNSDVIWIILTEMKYHADLKQQIAREISTNVMKIMNKETAQDLGDNIFPQENREAALRAFAGTVVSIVLYHKVFSEIIPITNTIDKSIDEAVEILLHGISTR